jgi:hypothetical protein
MHVQYTQVPGDLSENFQLSNDSCSSNTSSLFSEALLPLSPAQVKAFGGWRRPHEVFSGGEVSVIKLISPANIKQTLVTDCSFVSSLAVCAWYERKFGKRLISKIIFPQTPQGQPLVDLFIYLSICLFICLPIAYLTVTVRLSKWDPSIHSFVSSSRRRANTCSSFISMASPGKF